MDRHPDNDRSWHEWRYLKYAAVKHALPIEDQPYGNQAAICSVGPAWFAPPNSWLGTGGQDEYEHLVSLPECKRCARRLDSHE